VQAVCACSGKPTMSKREPLEWICRDRRLYISDRPLIMGILNVTPDSFFDGGCFFDFDNAIAQGRRLIAEGADILDIGGESTRPGSEEVPVEEEMRRVLPVIRKLARQTSALLSIDTRKAAVARAALAEGAHIVNDVSALTHDADMADVVRTFGAGVVLMHMQGTPRTMQINPQYRDVVTEVRQFLADRLAIVSAAGIDLRQTAVDPGIGFGKNLEHNLDLLACLEMLTALGRPVVVGVSRKRFIGQLTERPAPDRLAGTLGAVAYCIAKGAHILRVHDVAATRDVVNVMVTLVAREHGGRADGD